MIIGMNDLTKNTKSDTCENCLGCPGRTVCESSKYLEGLSSVDRHAFRGNWAVLEGSLENALIMLKNSKNKSEDAKKAIETATQALGKIKNKLM